MNIIGKPLNGEKTHALKPASIAILRRLAHHRVVRHEINPGTRDRLSREGLAEPSADQIGFWVITDAGRARLAEIDASPEALPSTKGLAAASLPTITDPETEGGR